MLKTFVIFFDAVQRATIDIDNLLQKSKEVWGRMSSSHLPVQSQHKNYHRKRCEICSKLAIKTPKRRQGRRSVFLLFTSNIFHFFRTSKVDFEQVNVCCVGSLKMLLKGEVKVFSAYMVNIRSNSAIRY